MSLTSRPLVRKTLGRGGSSWRASSTHSTRWKRSSHRMTLRSSSGTPSPRPTRRCTRASFCRDPSTASSRRRASAPRSPRSSRTSSGCARLNRCWRHSATTMPRGGPRRRTSLWRSSRITATAAGAFVGVPEQSSTRRDTGTPRGGRGSSFRRSASCCARAARGRGQSSWPSGISGRGARPATRKKKAGGFDAARRTTSPCVSRGRRPTTRLIELRSLRCSTTTWPTRCAAPCASR
mmetsp:Transcript_21180/g.84403  ORF Transcript_21180/g.84403 Transcript_21180/m.84403 type:complete len:236 (-) Transcript_21180:1762-2469(-)